MSDSSSFLDTPKVRKFITEQVSDPKQSNSSIAAAVTNEFNVPTSERSIRRAKRRWGLSRPGESQAPRGERPRLSTEKKGDEVRAEVVGKASPELSTPEDVMRERGLDPDDWDIVSVKVNEWDSMTSDKASGDNRVVKMRQLTVNLVRRKPEPPFLRAARPDGPTYRRPLPRFGDADTRKVVFTGDQQAPFHDETLHELFCQWLEHNQPGEGVLIGDTVDFPDISRHRYNPERSATVQQCVDTGYRLLKDYRESSSDTYWMVLPGNHDERLRNTLIDWSVELYGVTRARVESDEQEPPVLGVEHLLRLDELGIDYVDPNGQYDQAQVNLSPYLAARHGWLAVKGSGASALKTLEHLGYSIVVGHTHRQSIVHQTKHDINGSTTTLVGCETGCMCNLDGLGYSVAPDWQNGFATATIWPDGVFKIDLATYFDGTLAYQDQRYGKLTK